LLNLQSNLGRCLGKSQEAGIKFLFHKHEDMSWLCVWRCWQAYVLSTAPETFQLAHYPLNTDSSWCSTVVSGKGWVQIFMLFHMSKDKGKVHPTTGHKGPEGEKRDSSTLSLISALDAGGRSTPYPGHFTPGKDPVPIVQEAGWVPRPVWIGVENLAPTRIQSLDRPAHSQSLYRLCYPGHI
jgi:hypothetical protein